MAGEGGSSAHDFLPIGERPEWADLRPLPPPATPQPVVAIERDELLGDLMDYFWAAVARGEMSERVLALTGEIISDLNSSNYTVWEWRWRCVQALGGVQAHVDAEKALTQSVATANPKNYQLWNYRRRLALALGPTQGEEEMAFTAACLQFDAKNYHAWAHRQALLLAYRQLALWSAELAYTERLLREDVRNNSAWSQRIFVLRNAPPASVGPPAEAYEREVDFVAGQLRLAPHNESAWEALRGLAAWPGTTPAHALAADARYLALCREVLDASPACIPALSMLADVFLEQAALLQEAAAAGSGGGGSSSASAGASASADASGGGSTTEGAAQQQERSGGASIAAAIAQARRLAQQVLERLELADPIKQPYLRLEAAAVAAGAGC